MDVKAQLDGKPEQNQRQEPAKIVVVFWSKLSHFGFRLEIDRCVLGGEARLLVILL